MSAGNLLDGRRRTSSAVNLTVHPVTELPSGAAAHEPIRVVAHRLPRPHLVNGRPV